MPLLTAQDQWLATIEGAPHLEYSFWMPAGSTEGQARMTAWTYWSHARSYNSTPDRPVASQFLRIAKVASAMREVPTLDYPTVPARKTARAA